MLCLVEWLYFAGPRLFFEMPLVAGGPLVWKAGSPRFLLPLFVVVCHHSPRLSLGSWKSAFRGL